MAERWGCLVNLLTSSLRTCWCQLIPSSILRHHWSSASILRTSFLVIAQHSEPQRKIGRMQVLYSFNFYLLTIRFGVGKENSPCRHTCKCSEEWYSTWERLQQNYISSKVSGKASWISRPNKFIFTQDIRLSVRPSVTLRYCVKTMQAKSRRSSLWAASRTLVYCDKILCQWLQGLPSSEGEKKGYPLKNATLPLWVKTVADRYRHAAYDNKHWWQAF